MATIYTIKLVSHWVRYPEKEIEDKIKRILMESGNVISINVKEDK